MSNIFISSDLHLSHGNILTFLRKDGAKLRNFSSIEEHDEFIIEQHNKVVKPNDRWYCLGDLTFHNRYLHLVGRLNGRKVLIKGNHDVLKLSQYIKYFDDIRACHSLAGILFTHIPVHPDSLYRWKCNVHGHLHADRVMSGVPGIYDERYQSVCMEQLDNYTPISLEQLNLRIKNLGLLNN